MQPAETVGNPTRGQPCGKRPEEIHFEPDDADEEREPPIPGGAQISQQTDVQQTGGREHPCQDREREGGQHTGES